MKPNITNETRLTYRNAIIEAVEAVIYDRAYPDACITFDEKSGRFEYWNSASAYSDVITGEIVHENTGSELPWNISTVAEAEAIAIGTKDDPDYFIREAISSIA